ncbi:Mss4-like protein [Xylariales sp. PMI_506]|nr:Mss4-like protein [Xylariales sp. PMI_506]
MLIYKDIATGSEILSDSFPSTEVDGVLLEVDCAMISVGGESFDTGANASAEEAGDDLEDGVQKVNNIIHTFQLQEMPMDKAGYKAHAKAFIKKVKKHLDESGASDEEKDLFKTKGQAQLMSILKNFDKYECYIGEAGPSAEDDQQVILLNYRDDGITPFFTYWKHAMKAEKV